MKLINKRPKYDYTKKEWYLINYNLIINDYGTLANFEKEHSFTQGVLSQSKRNRRKISSTSKYFKKLNDLGYLIKLEMEK